MVIICDEEGRLKGKEYNSSILGVDFVGDIIFCGVKDGELADIPIDFKDFKRLFRFLWRMKDEGENEAIRREAKDGK